MLYSGRNIIRLLPPLVMDETTVSRAVDIMDKILKKKSLRLGLEPSSRLNFGNIAEENIKQEKW
jgi:hypothetical protein